MKIVDEHQEIRLQEADWAIVVAARVGEPEACNALYNRYCKRALAAISRITRNAADAEDALQECFLKVFSHLDTFDGRAALSTWITRIAINSALMVLRKRRRRPELSIDFSDHSEGWTQWEPVDDRLNPERDFLQGERREILQQGISSLRPNMRDVLQIYVREEAQIRTIAQLAQLSVPAVKSRLLRARNELHRRLADRI